MGEPPATRALNTRIRTVIPCPKGGQVVTMGFPGIYHPEPQGNVAASAQIDLENMAATLHHEALANCDFLVILVEQQELPAGAIDVLRDLAAVHGIAIPHLPIVDYDVPDDRFEKGWAQIAPQITRCLSLGRTVGFSCHYGAGRSGTIAAGVLIDQGCSAEEAITLVRAQFPPSIESEVQMAWLEARAQSRVPQGG